MALSPDESKVKRSPAKIKIRTALEIVAELLDSSEVMVSSGLEAKKLQARKML